MFERFTVRMAMKLLRRADLSVESRSLLTTVLLDKLGALPFDDIITINESGEILVKGNQLDFEKAKQLREAARAALNNPALKLIWPSIAHAAVVTGVHKAENERQTFWARAVLWWSQKEQEMLYILAGETPNGNSAL